MTSDDVCRAVTDGEHRDFKEWPRYRPHGRDRRDEPDNGERGCGEHRLATQAAPAPPPRGDHGGSAPGGVSADRTKPWSRDRRSAVREPDQDLTQHDGDCGGNVRERRSDASERSRRISDDEEQSAHGDRHDRERDGQRCESAEMPDREGRRREPHCNTRDDEGAKRVADRFGNVHRRVPSFAIPPFGQAWHEIPQREDRCERQLIAGSKNLRRISNEDRCRGEPKDGIAAPAPACNCGEAYRGGREGGARHRRLRLDQERVGDHGQNGRAVANAPWHTQQACCVVDRERENSKIESRNGDEMREPRLRKALFKHVEAHIRPAQKHRHQQLPRVVARPARKCACNDRRRADAQRSAPRLPAL